MRPLEGEEGSVLRMRPNKGKPGCGKDTNMYHWERIQGHDGFGFLKFREFYVVPDITEADLKDKCLSGANLILSKEKSYLAVWFFNGKRFRSVNGQYMKVDDDLEVIVGKSRHLARSIFQTYRPDESPYTNFPCMHVPPSEHFYSDSFEVSDDEDDKCHYADASIKEKQEKCDEEEDSIGDQDMPD